MQPGYKQILEINEPFDPSDSELDKLAEFVTSGRKRIPSGYTYLGQFIDHDISRDSSVISKVTPWTKIDLSSISNERQSFLNLEALYGLEKSPSPKIPSRKDLLETASLLKVGKTSKGLVRETFFYDLPRGKDRLAIIADPRNDENLALAQTHLAFIKFHNAVCKYLGGRDTEARFNEARKIVIQHYQWIILKDFLPRILKKSVLDKVFSGGNQFYFPTKSNPFIPIEFTGAAYRAGHSMILDSYNWNRNFNNDPSPHADQASILQLMRFTGPGGAFTESLPSDWIINWKWFFNIKDPVTLYDSMTISRNKFNFAAPFDTKIAAPLGSQGKFKRETSLVAFDLYRPRAMNLASGQEIAKRILGSQDRVLKPEQIANLLPDNLKFSFSNKTPLWFYLLAEAEINEQGETLGEVGSQIVAETFHGLLKINKTSILNLEEDFRPLPDFCINGVFGMPELLSFIDKNSDFDELNPLGD